MPQSATPKLGLYRTLSDGSENVSVVLDLLNNWDKVDAAMGFTAVTSSTRPASAFNGQGIRETDTSRIYVSNGTLPGSASFTTQPLVFGVRAVSASTARAVKTGLTADTVDDRFFFQNDGTHWWGSGAATVDTVLYRSAADTLRTDDSFVVGTNLTVLGIGQETLLERTTDTTTTSDATVNADTYFTFAMAASAKYHVTIVASVNGTAGDFKSMWVVPASATGVKFCDGPAVASTNRDDTTVRKSAHGFATEVPYGTVATGCYIREEGLVTTSGAGTWTWQWSQNSSNAAGTTVETGSYCRIRRVG
jgi:hypothetical protein